MALFRIEFPKKERKPQPRFYIRRADTLRILAEAAGRFSGYELGEERDLSGLAAMLYRLPVVDDDLVDLSAAMNAVRAVETPKLPARANCGLNWIREQFRLCRVERQAGCSSYTTSSTTAASPGQSS